MKLKVSEWVDQFPNFHELTVTDQIVRLVYFHTIIERRETVSRSELQQLFDFAEVPVPEDLPQMLFYLAGKGNRLIKKSGEYSLRREVRQSIDQMVNSAGPTVASPAHAAPGRPTAAAFEFSGRVFKDRKVEALLDEARRCYSDQCWNACGILMRIVLERTLDSADARVKATPGLKGKLNVGISTAGVFSQTIVDTLKELKTAKLIGDIVAHHSSILLDEIDINLVIPSLRMLLKEVTSV
jgi:hypothetical protein